MRIAHVSDTHLGYSGGRAKTEEGKNVRRLDFECAWIDACEKIRKLKPDLVIHSGDAFHQPRPPYSAIYAFAVGLEILSPIPTIVIGGNHETSRLRTERSPLEVLEVGRAPQLTIVPGFSEQVVRVGDLEVFCVPWGRLVVKGEQPFESSGPWPRIFVSHGDAPTIPFANPEPGHGCVTFKTLDGAWDYIALGHIHQYQSPWRENVWYAGSTERCGWSDEDASPGFLIADLTEGEDPVVAHVDVVCRPFFNIGTIDTGGSLDFARTAIFEKCQQATPGSIARVKLLGLTRKEEWMASNWLPPRLVDLQVGFERSVFEYEKKEWVDKRDSIVEMFHDFVNERGLDPAFRSNGLRYLQAAQDRQENEG